MLDRKTKDIDASIEILEDRRKQFKLMWRIFFIIGWIAVVASACLFPYNYDEIGIGMGIAVLIFATWFYIDMNYFNTLILMRKLDKRDEK